MPIVYSNKFVELEENASDELVLSSKEVNLPNLLKLILAFLVCSVLGAGFGLIAYWAGGDLLSHHTADRKWAAFALTFGLAGTAFAFVVIREFCFGCLPKGMTFSRNERICVVRNYLVFRWSIPSDQIEAVGLKIGYNFGGNTNQRYCFSCLYIMKSGLVKSLRCCSPSEGVNTLHEAHSDGNAVGNIVATALGVPLLHRVDGKWIKQNEGGNSKIHEEQL